MYHSFLLLSYNVLHIVSHDNIHSIASLLDLHNLVCCTAHLLFICRETSSVVRESSGAFLTAEVLRVKITKCFRITCLKGPCDPREPSQVCGLSASHLMNKDNGRKSERKLHFSALGSVSSAGFSTQGGSQTTRLASACARMKSSPWRTSVSKHKHTHTHIYSTHCTNTHRPAGWQRKRFTSAASATVSLSTFRNCSTVTFD